MKLSLSIALMAAATAVQGFAPTATFGVRLTHTQLAMSRPDASEAVKAALEASKKFGPTSPEARMAWETVEEMDSSDSNTYVWFGLVWFWCCWLFLFVYLFFNAYNYTYQSFYVKILSFPQN